MLKNNKKAEMDDIKGLIMMVVIAAVVLAIGLVVMGEFKTATGEAINPIKVTNITLGLSLDAYVDLPGCIPTDTAAVNQLYNWSGTNDDGQIILLQEGNYTILLNRINISKAGVGGTGQGVGINGTDVNITYTCKHPSGAYNVTGANITQLAKFPSWIGIIIVVALAMITLGYFYTRR